MDVIVTIDTEADDQWDRTRTELTTDNLACVPRFQQLCERYELKPTYLCTWEIVEDPRFEPLREYQLAGRAEVGAHLHPWTNPPMTSPENGIEREAFGMYPSELDPASFQAKLEQLTESIENRTGVRPRSYRAGRWGLSGEHVPILSSLGYLVDCSVTPLRSWAHMPGVRTGGPDFRAAPAAPYFLDSEDLCRPGDSGLLEVPATIVSARSALARSKRLQETYAKCRQTLPGKILNRLLRLDPQWLRPYRHMTAGRLVNVCKVAARRGLPAVEMMFHSSELMAGGSPYNRDEAEIERLYERLETVFGYMRDRAWRGVTLSDFAREFTARGSGGRAVAGDGAQ
jgi:hypothetical protein